ncbi:beta-ketoacyl-ACP synthase I [Desulfobulbus alkaliphilus]|uniref:beta-ketoacyl-ACP synthase I n=1 Tax=Desulfobulbus alkaliphilus TaxID=869814 RepID=UPI001963CA28|nr:beta-ketoacyl-ACP synthase I [Desulfobulbus alkaliphilus]MBM9537720.1 beta-ketoacyl-ACP synthase I [Desulfobulbus alkaliphilus]
MRRVVITGMGIVSPLGDTVEAVLASLRESRSGIRYHEPYRKIGLRSLVGGFTRINLKEQIEKKNLRFMGHAAAYASIAMQQAIADAGLEEDEVSHPRTGLIIGSGGTSAENVVATADVMRAKGLKRLSPFMVPRTMSSTVSACLTSAFRIKGLCYSISSACATGSHCIGAAMEQIMMGRQDLVFAGGSDEEHWTQTAMFDAMGALSTRFNDTPKKASRPYDRNRDGFVVANGAGVVVLEELERARRRGARMYGEVVGYGATADGYEMVSPSGEGAVRCIRLALASTDADVDYINAHGTSTPIGDLVELRAIKEVFGGDTPPISSTKSLSGHSLGAAGVHEAIYSLLMLQNNFIAGSVNIEDMDPDAVGMHIVTENRDADLAVVMSNSYGFGGTNACLVFQKI